MQRDCDPTLESCSPDQTTTPATSGQTETPAPGPTSDDYKQGYQDGRNGGESNTGPRDGDALTDYNEGYAKGHYEFTQASATPAPATSDQMPTPASATSDQTPTPAPATSDQTPTPAPAQNSQDGGRDDAGQQQQQNGGNTPSMSMRDRQLACVVRLGGCSSGTYSRDGGTADEDIPEYNKQCKEQEKTALHNGV